MSDQKTSFAGLGSGPILEAAMQYPTALIAGEQAPPLSLTASDGTGLALVSLEGHAVIDGPLAFTELRLRFQNPRNRIIEGRFAITLPPGAAISRLAMHIDSGWQEAEMVERQLARRAYEDFLHRRQDPALLEKEAGNQFRARIFPIPALGVKDIIISYSHNLVGADAKYKLPLRGLPEIEKLEVTALLGRGAAAGKALEYRKIVMQERNYVPDRDFEVAPRADIAGLRGGDLVAARLRPQLDTEVQSADGLVVLFDTSASRAPGFARHVRALGELVARLRATHGDAMTLAVATFDQDVVPVYAGTIAGFGKTQLDRILSRRPLGASNLHAALHWAGNLTGARRAVVISDGVATAGPSGAGELRALVEGMSGKLGRLDMILAGGIRDREMAQRLVRGTLERDGTVLDLDQPADILARRLSQTTVSGIAVNVPGAKWVWPQRLDGVQPGDEVLIFAGLRPGSLAARKPLQISLSGPNARNLSAQTASIELTAVAGPLIERAAVQAQIARLSGARDEIAPGAAGAGKKREAIKQQIIDLSTRYRVLSDFTALLVLETERDYERFGIDRRSLADILTVGPRGVEVFHRQKPVVQMAIARQDPPAASDGKKKPKKAKEEDRGEGVAGGNIHNEPAGGQADNAEALEVNKPAAEPEETGGRIARSPRPMSVSRRQDQPMDLTKSLDDDDGDESEEEAEADYDEGDADSRPAERQRTAGIDRPSPSTRRPPPPAPPPSEDTVQDEPEIPQGPPALTGKMADITNLLARGKKDQAVVAALSWQRETPGNVMALIALGEALEARGNAGLAARAYGSIIDLFPSRADLRRMAGQRLERLGHAGASLAADSYAKAVEKRPDHLTGHRLLGYALLRQGKYEAAFDAVEAGLKRKYPSGRFAGGLRILREDLGLIAAAWLKKEPSRSGQIDARLAAAGATLPRAPSLRFVLYWETDANDVDFHIHDGKGEHAYYSNQELDSGGRLYADVTTGYGPECFAIEGQPQAYPYRLWIHYYSRGPMGYGMGKLEIIEHDGAGNLRFEHRPFVVMNDGAYVDLGMVGPGQTGKSAQIAQ